MKKHFRFVAVLAILALVLGACGGDDEGAGEEGFKACEVTDVGGIDDRSFNQTAWAGAERAASELGIEAKFLESQAETDYVPNINQFVEEGCDIIITVGFLLGDATKEAANANPEVPFAILDYAYAEGDITNNNVLGNVYSTAEAAFLAGYAAAAVSETGTIGTFGGINIGGPVTDFMDGFAWGARYHNEQKGTNVQVLGWDPEAKDGLFVGNFESKEDGRTAGQSLIDEGADIILPVAGPVGQGTAALAQERGDVLVVGVDSDWFESVPQYKDVYLTSVLKKLDVSVFDAIKAVQDDTFEGGLAVFTLANGGVGLAPFHDLDERVPADTKSELETIEQQIIDGSLDINRPPA